jgi:dTDP-4-dehydrorhamnose reductase
MQIGLFGSTGMLGTYIFHFLKDKYNIICITRDIFDIEKTDWAHLKQYLENNYLLDIITDMQHP